MQSDTRKLWLVIEVILTVAAAGITFVFLKHQVFDNYQVYDDEGYMLLSLDHYLRYGGLYTKTYTQYGPFYFYIQQFFHWLLHLPVNHDGGRILTMLYCSISSLFGGLFIWRISRSLLLGSAALLGVAVLSCKLGDEPGHPQEVVLFILVLGVLLTTRAAYSTSTLFILGALGAAATLTKLNVGFFYMAALAHTLICLVQKSRLRQVGIVLTLVYAIFFPLALMKDHLGSWALQYCIFAILCGLSVFLQGTWTVVEASLSNRHLVYAAFGFGSGAAIILGASLLQGVSPYALLDGIILSPSAHPRVFWIPWRLGWIALAWAATGLALVVGLRIWPRIAAHWEWIDAARCFAGMAAILALTSQPYRLKWTAPLLPLFLLPGREKPWSASRLLPRLFVTDLAVTQLLQPYPVGGSQLNIAAIPGLLWGFVAIFDGSLGMISLSSRFLRFVAPPKFSRAALLGLIAVVLGVALTAIGLERGYRFLSRYPASGLPGSGLVRMIPSQAAVFREIATTLRTNCDTLFTMPGMGSLNFWSGVPTPNGSNLTVWVKAFNAERQQDILDILKTRPRACVVYHPLILASWMPGGTQETENSLLASFILKKMRVAEERQGYEIRVMGERKVPWIYGNGKAAGDPTR